MSYLVSGEDIVDACGFGFRYSLSGAGFAPVSWCETSRLRCTVHPSCRLLHGHTDFRPNNTHIQLSPAGFLLLIVLLLLQAKVLRNFFYYYLFALSAAELFHPNRCVPKTHHICLYAKWTKRRIFFWDIQVQKKKKSSLIKSYFFLIIN